MNPHPVKSAWDVVLFEIVPIFFALLFAIIVTATFGLFDVT